MNWVALFSQTGSEIAALSTKLGKKPDLIITNNSEEKIKYSPELRALGVTIMSGKHEVLMKYLESQSVLNRKDTIMTLHGYLRLLPANICEQYDIFNGHPGLITLYPELKGKDPQEKVWNNLEKYTKIGSIVHKCIEEVDSGSILSTDMVPNRCTTRDEVYTVLRETSFRSWYNFLESRLV